MQSSSYGNYPKSVQKHLDKLPDKVYERVLYKIQQLSSEPRPKGAVKMKGNVIEYRICIGDY
jgi:mRNA interferase RelE/StbE